MARKAADAPTIVALPTPPAPRLTPTRHLSEAEHRHWVSITSALPSSALDAVDADALVAYCAHSAQAEQALEWLNTHPPTDKLWARVNAVQALHSGKALAWARSLRLTRVARRDRDRAATDARRGPTEPADFHELLQRYRERPA
jgi:hypothetical protein